MRQPSSSPSTPPDRYIQPDWFTRTLFNPLVAWSTDDVWAYLRANDVPYNALHDRGYPSIGCAPCTRAVKPGEDFRAGRWWWEAPEHKECGLHGRGIAGPVVVEVAAAANETVTP